jgi:hypothetical protein
MSSGTYNGPSTTPIIPNLYPTTTQTTVVPTTTVVQQPTTTIVYTQPVAQTQPTTVVQQQPTTNSVLGNTIHAPAKNGIVINSNTTGVSATSDVPGICVNDTVNYTLSYANTTTGAIQNAMLIVTLPAEIDYKSSTSQASFNERNHTVTIFIGTVAKGQSGVVYMQGTANRMVNGTATITTRVDFTFTKANGATETTTSYVIHSGTNCGNALGANVLGSGFLPTSFIGWVLLAIVVCAIIFLARKFFGKEEGHAHGGSVGHQAH